MEPNRWVFALLSLGLWASSAFAVGVDGSFEASKECDAYISAKKQTNPDHATVRAGQQYELIEINKPGNPNWYRLNVPSASPTERWVASDCGKASYQQPTANSNPAASDNAAQCHTTNRIDSYVFAVSWQPAFCETHQGKPECQIHAPASFQARNFTLHGLWPNQNSCGTNYGFCSDVAQQKNFCDYRPVPMNPATEKALGIVMPSVAAGSCLDRHEWYKHGTCQTRSADQYFRIAMNLLKQFNDSGIAVFIAENVGKDVSLDAFLQKIDASLGAGAHKRIKLGCDKNKNLVDIYINLPDAISADSSLKELIAKGAAGYSAGSCGPAFHVDKL